MHRKVVAVWVSFVIVTISLFFLIEIAPQVKANTIYVGGTNPGNFSTIQEGIDAANPGDTVFVFSGTYYENVEVDKSINLIGENNETTVINGSGLAPAVYITNDWVNVTSFTLKSNNDTTTKSAVTLNTAEYCSIMDNNLLDSYKGAMLWHSNNNIVYGNNILNNVNGIHNYYSLNTNITHNTIVNNEYGIQIQSSTENKVYQNTMIGNGLHIWGDSQSHWDSHEIDTSNTVNGKPVYYWKDTTGGTIPMGAGQIILGNCADVIVEGQSLSNGTVGIILGYSSGISVSNMNLSYQIYGLYIYGCQQLTISNCRLTENYIGGITIRNSFGTVIEQNTILRNNDGIYHYHCTQSSIRYNELLYNRDALYVDSGSNHNISFNNILYSSHIGFICANIINTEISWNNILSNYIGLRLIGTKNSNIFRNNLSSNESHGINLQVSHENTITENVITNSIWGIILSQSDRNTFTKNDIYSNTDYGFYLYQSHENLIHHNDIINNPTQAYDESNDNFWDDSYPSGGNYWSDYIGVDNYSGPNQDILGSDGIGDTNYIIDSDSVDNYPLMEPNIFKPPENSITLKEGWNLISIPFVQTETDLGIVLDSISGSYDAVQWYYGGDFFDPWKHNHTSKSEHMNDLKNIYHTMSFWIHITNPGDTIFIYNGTQPASNQTIQFHPGWNMVGYPSLSSHNRTVGLNNLVFGSDVDAIQWYDTPTKTWHLMGPDDHFIPGRGYWMHSYIDSGWEVPL
jgi:parallel beta-helix repeat protein